MRHYGKPRENPNTRKVEVHTLLADASIETIVDSEETPEAEMEPIEICVRPGDPFLNQLGISDDQDVIESEQWDNFTDIIICDEGGVEEVTVESTPVEVQPRPRAKIIQTVRIARPAPMIPKVVPPVRISRQAPIPVQRPAPRARTIRPSPLSLPNRPSPLSLPNRPSPLSLPNRTTTVNRPSPLSLPNRTNTVQVYRPSPRTTTVAAPKTIKRSASPPRVAWSSVVRMATNPSDEEAVLEGIMLEMNLFVCKMCSEEAGTFYDLRRHVLLKHRGVKYAICCDYSVNCPATALYDHIRWHVDHNRFTCHECGYRGTSHLELTGHMKRKHKPKKFQCKFCWEKFRDNVNYWEHIKEFHIHKLRMVCETCGQVFLDPDEHYKHSMLHQMSEEEISD